MAARAADRARSESRLSRRIFSIRRRTRRPQPHRADERQATAADRPHRVTIIEESNPRLLSFNAGELDYVNVPSDLADTVLDAGNKLRPEFTQRGVTLTRATLPSLNYMYFNMADPIVGGYSKDRIALRRAIVIGFDTPALIRTIYKGQAYPATQPIPPNLPGHDEAWNIRFDYDPAAAKALPDRFGYVDRNGDGWRDRPDGKPLLLMMASAARGARPAIRRALAAKHGGPWDSDRIYASKISRSAEDGARWKIADDADRVDHQLRRGRRVRAAAL